MGPVFGGASPVGSSSCSIPRAGTYIDPLQGCSHPGSGELMRDGRGADRHLALGGTAQAKDGMARVLVATGLLALVSLAALGPFAAYSTTGLLFFIPMWLAVNAVFAYAVHRTAYSSIEVRDPFCVSCALCRRDHARDDGAQFDSPRAA